MDPILYFDRAHHVCADFFDHSPCERGRPRVNFLPREADPSDPRVATRGDHFHLRRILRNLEQVPPDLLDAERPFLDVAVAKLVLVEDELDRRLVRR